MTRQTLADSIVYALTEEIISKRLMPGCELDEGRLAQRFGASRTPVREALRQLAASGLVSLRPHRAPIVARVDPGLIGEMFEAMAELEALCAGHAARRMSPTGRVLLERHHKAMGEAMRCADVNSYRAGNLVLHGMIYDGAGNRYLQDLALATRRRVAPYRGTQLEMPARLAASWAEHDAIVTAILRADADRASASMRIHLSHTREAVAALAMPEMPKI
jgi:DNA-binding GntR family transcriptional regulator